jgi:hypothetical protein
VESIREVSQEVGKVNENENPHQVSEYIYSTSAVRINPHAESKAKIK